MSMLEALMLLALLLVPLLLGAVLGYVRRPWWWAAAAAVALFNFIAIAPPPEPGEPRVAADDLVFLLICSAIITAIALLGFWVGRWAVGFAVRRAISNSPR